MPVLTERQVAAMTNKPRHVPVKIRITVVGAKGVGKSACSLRFLTKKYVHEYKSKGDSSYHNQVTVDEAVYDVEVIDVTKYSNIDSLPVQKCESVDAFVVVYSINNRHSFDQASDWHKTLGDRYPDLPILLLANKLDVAYNREVEPEEGKDIAGELFYEVAAATEEPTLQKAFAALIRKIMVLRNCQTVKRKLSMTKKIGNIFTRKDSIRRISTSASM